MKKSSLVTLVLSTALVSGCDEPNQYGNPSYSANAPVTNNAYVNGLGYYHAPYHGWYEYPYNYYRPGFGYYHGGIYSPQPFMSDVVASHPSIRSAFGGGGGDGGGGGARVGSGASPSSVSRGGFGSIGHGGSSGE